MSRCIPLLLALLAAASSPAIAQELPPADAEHETQDLPLVIAGIQEALALPNAPGDVFTGPLHPGLMLGSEFQYLEGRFGRVFQTANLGFFHHKNLDSMVLLNTEIAYGYGFDFGLGLEALLGVGYGHAFVDQPVYSLKTGASVRDRGKPALLASFALGVEYDFRAHNLMPASIFLRYQPLLQIQASPPPEIAQIPRAVAMVGAKIHFTK